jgi:hypothetical protein
MKARVEVLCASISVKLFLRSAGQLAFRTAEEKTIELLFLHTSLRHLLFWFLAKNADVDA